MGLAPSQGNGWVRFQPALSRKVGQILTGVDKVRVELARWRNDYNHHRPCLGLGWLTPAEFANQ